MSKFAKGGLAHHAFYLKSSGKPMDGFKQERDKIKVFKWGTLVADSSESSIGVGRQFRKLLQKTLIPHSRMNAPFLSPCFSHN